MAVRTHRDQRLVVHYSLSFHDATREAGLLKQLDVSLTTLRATNPDLDVIVFCHGRVPDRLVARLDHHRANMIVRRDPVDRLRDELGPIGAVLGRFGPIHKFLNFGDLTDLGVTDTLYLDADTVVFGDLTRLVPDTRRPTIVAREEVGSSRCRFGAQRGYLDEELLAATAAAVGITPAPAVNTGVMLIHGSPVADDVRAFEQRYLAWLLRFAMWMVEHPADPNAPQYADVFDLDELRAMLMGDAARRLRRLATPYPSVNRWLVEEVAAWVALGANDGLDFSVFDPGEVAQGGEPLEAPLPRSVWHYFSGNQDGMTRRLGLAPGWP